MVAYATVAQLTSWAGDQHIPDSGSGLTALVLESASRSVEQYCNRTFGRDNTASARLARAVLPVRPHTQDVRTVWESPGGATGGLVVHADDFYSTTGLIVETAPAPYGAWTTIPTTSVTVDARVDPEHPYTRLWIDAERAQYARVTALYGWSAVPDAVTLAVLTAALSSLRRRYSPDGVPIADGVGGPVIVADLAASSRKDLSPYRRRAVG